MIYIAVIAYNEYVWICSRNYSFSIFGPVLMKNGPCL